MSENYLNEVIEELYDALFIDHYTQWPAGTTTEKKLRLLKGMQKYFESKDTTEDYKRCAKIQIYIDAIHWFDLENIDSGSFRNWPDIKF